MGRSKSASRASGRQMKNSELQIVGLPRTQGTVEEVDEVQRKYIENMQQQIYFLELEISHLRAIAEDSNRAHPALKAEVAKMTEKVSETKKESDFLKVEGRKKDTKLDLMQTEQEKLKQNLVERNETHQREKSAFLDELLELRKMCEMHVDKEAELNVFLTNSKEREEKLRTENTSIREDLTKLKEQCSHSQRLVENFRRENQKIQNSLLQKQVELERIASGEREVKDEAYQIEIRELNQRLEESEQSCRQERHLRCRLADDNGMLLKRHADLETEIASMRAHVKEHVTVRTSLEAVHDKLVREAATTRSLEIQLKTEIETLTDSLRREQEKCAVLISQLNEEKRRRTVEELAVARLQSKITELEERLRGCRQDNSGYQRDLTIAKDSIARLQKEEARKNLDLERMSQQVVSIHGAVTKFQQCSDSAVKVQENRWRELINLTEGIQTISQRAINETAQPLVCTVSSSLRP